MPVVELVAIRLLELARAGEHDANTLVDIVAREFEATYDAARARARGVNAEATSPWQLLGTSFGVCSVAPKGVRPGSRARPPTLCAQPARVGWWARAVAFRVNAGNDRSPSARFV
jgi:hypothetical protein